MKYSTDAEQGQVLLEYILMIAVALGILAILGAGFTRIRDHLWQQMSCEVAAPCPGCPPPESVRNQLTNACR